MVLIRGPNRLGLRSRGGLTVLALLAALLLLALSRDASAQEPPVETPPTEAGLGDCVEGMKVSVLNSGFNALPEDQSKRDGNGGFETFIVLNCKAYEIRWEILDDAGRIVSGGTGANRINDKFDEVEWVDLETIEYQRHTSDVVDTDGNILFRAGDVVVDEDGNGIPSTEPPPAVTAYRFKFEFANDEVQQGTEMVRPLTNNRDYLLKFDMVPYEGAPNNHIHGWVFEIVGKLGGNWWQKIIRVLSPTNWLEKGLTFLFQGIGTAVHGGMCFAMGHFMTDSEREAFDRFDSNGDGRITTDDELVENADDPHKPNANGNCKKPDKSPREELEELRTAAYIEVNEQRALAGLPPLHQRQEKRDTYLSEVLDGRDPRSGDVPLATQVHYELSHITLAPRLVLERVGAAPPRQSMDGGITTFTGLLTGTPPELTYERGIVRIGWSALLNVMVAALALVIAWIGLSQIVRSFIGGQRNMADWRETIPRLILALIAALTSYWWCSLLVDVADGVSRYVAAAMRVTPADITLTLGNALFAIVARNVSHSWLAAVPVAGVLLVAIKVAFTGLIVLLMKIFAITVLLVIAQFVMRIVLLNLLIIISPLGMLMWALPETSGWGRRWVTLFTATLFQHGIQIIAFAVAIWFVRLATPVGIVADTGSVNSALQAVLPTQMFWALLIGIMAMIVTFKVPSILGQGSLEESFVSTISFAAVGFRSLGFMAGGGAGGPLGFLGGGGDPGGAPAAGGLSAQAPVRGVASGVTAATTNVAAGAVVGGFRSLRAGFSAIRGAGSFDSPQISAGSGPSPASGSPPSFSDGSEQEPAFTAERVTPITRADGPVSVTPTGTGTVRGDASRGGPSGGVSGEAREAGPLTPREQHQEHVRQIVGGIGGRAYLRGRRGGLRAMSRWYVRDNGTIRLSTQQERALIDDLNVERFNRAFEARPAAEPHTLPSTGPRGVTDDMRARALMGSDVFDKTSESGVVAVNDNYVADGWTVRPATAGERRVIGDMGRDRFNRIFSARRAGAETTSIPQRQTYFDARRARSEMGEGAFTQARREGLTALGGPYVLRGGQTRLATATERQLVSDMGRERFNRIFNPPHAPAAAGSSAAGDSPAERVSRGPDDPGTERPSVMGQMGRAFREGYSGYMEQARVTLVRDVDSDRVSPETSEGHVARQTLGEEFQETADRRIRYVGSGAWQNTGGAIRPLTGEQVHARAVMGEEDFTRAMDSSIRTQGQRNSQGEYMVTENGQQRTATPAEARLIAPDQLGVQGFNRAMGTRSQFMGEGVFVRDEGTTRIATENESRLLNQVGEQRFNEVMGRRIEDAGEGYRVDTMPETGEVLQQAGRDSARLAREAREGGERIVERGRELAEEGRRTRFSQGLGDWGRSTAQELGGREDRPPYDAQRVENDEQRRRYYGMRSPDE